jgi:hypothetical protein
VIQANALSRSGLREKAYVYRGSGADTATPPDLLRQLEAQDSAHCDHCGGLLPRHLASECTASLPELLTTAEVATFCGVDRATVRRWTRAGLLPEEGPRTGPKYRRAAIEEFVGSGYLETVTLASSKHRRVSTGNDCGTTAGYDRHRRRGEETCQACRDAITARAKKRYAERRAAS